MRHTTRIMTVVLVSLLSVSAPRLARAEPERQWVWLAEQGVWGYGYQIQDGPHRGLWRIDAESKTAPAMSDPYGFADVLNRYRASYGLPPVNYDPDLAAWAVQNNIQQCQRGIGHHIVPNCYQNSGWNFDSAESVAQGWMNSSGHRANMLLPSMRSFGIAYGPGPYWTMNAR
jgi:hypothetical protein